jgi:5-methylcytosine-specific restriction endonuclease McrA
MKYAEKLKDPRWQERRLEIFKKADFTCESCGDTESTLCVHHDIYLADREPWEYSDAMLRCFCEACHEYTHSLEKVARVLRAVGDLHG